MSKTYHSKKEFKKAMDETRHCRELQSSENGVTVLATLNLRDNGYHKVIHNLTRHPSGTKASGLRQGYEGKGAVTGYRDRFGDAYEQSSRLRRIRKAGKRAVRLKLKFKLRSELNEQKD